MSDVQQLQAKLDLALVERDEARRQAVLALMAQKRWKARAEQADAAPLALLIQFAALAERWFAYAAKRERMGGRGGECAWIFEKCGGQLNRTIDNLWLQLKRQKEATK